MGELKKACNRHGIVLGAYYFNLDRYRPYWIPYSHGGSGPHAFSPQKTVCPEK